MPGIPEMSGEEAPAKDRVVFQASQIAELNSGRFSGPVMANPGTRTTPGTGYGLVDHLSI